MEHQRQPMKKALSRKLDLNGKITQLKWQKMPMQ